MILELISYLGIVVGFVFLVLAIASGLYYVSELVEEHTEPTKRFLKRLIQFIMVVFVLLWIFDNLPFWLTIFSIVSYYVYYLNLHRFPYVELTSPIFILSCILVIINHFLWFNHFHHPYIPPLQERLKQGYKPPKIPDFTEICAFFGLLVWFVPFALFVSLSANDNILPHHVEANANKKKNNGLAKVLVANAREKIYALSRTLGYELDPNHGTLI